MDTPDNTLPKEERLCNRKDISDLLAGGTFCDAPGCLRFCYRKGTGSGLNRIMVSVPKQNFKRAVRRNLLKRRIRESYRKQTHAIDGTGTDILFIYSGREIMSYSDIFASIGAAIQKINKCTQKDRAESSGR